MNKPKDINGNELSVGDTVVTSNTTLAPFEMLVKGDIIRIDKKITIHIGFQYSSSEVGVLTKNSETRIYKL